MKNKTEIYYDGSCRICHHGAERLKKTDLEEKFIYRDFSSGNFNPKEFDLKDLDKAIHLKTTEGRVIKGADAMIYLLLQVPAYEWLGKLLSFPLIYPLTVVGYQMFARTRKYFPQRPQ